MRTYTNLLLFEEVLLNLPTTSSRLVKAFQNLFSPTIPIVEEDCGTLLGREVPVYFGIEGRIELATDEPIDRDRITQLLQQGIYSVKIRSQHSCASTGGLCKKCYLANPLYRGNSVEVGDLVKLSPKYTYTTDVITGDGSRGYSLSENSDNYDDVIVFKDGVKVTEIYSIVDNSIIFLDNKESTDTYVIYFLKESANPLLGYLARSYSGSLFGLLPLPTETTIINSKLYSTILTDNYLRVIQSEIENFKDIPSNTIEYLDTISDRLEKALVIFYLYVIYGSMN